MSIREQERRQKQAERGINERMRQADIHVRNAMDERSRQADLRAKEIVRRIEKGDADPRPLRERVTESDAAALLQRGPDLPGAHLLRAAVVTACRTGAARARSGGSPGVSARP